MIVYRWVPISSDIEKAFLHVHLHENDRDYTRFLWLSDPTEPESEFDTYRFKVVLFGATCSPFMLHAVINCHLLQHNFPTAQDMLENLYVDNIGCDSEESVIEYYKTARSIMMDANFNLRSWASNSSLLTDQASKDKIEVDTTNVNILSFVLSLTSHSLWPKLEWYWLFCLGYLQRSDRLLHLPPHVDGAETLFISHTTDELVLKAQVHLLWKRHMLLGGHSGVLLLQ